MKVDWAFLCLVGLYATTTAVVTLYPISGLVDEEALRSIVAAEVISLFHLLFGYFTIEAGFERKNTTFLKIVLGGMVVRLFLMAGVVFLLLKIFHYDAFSLMFALLVFYVINLVLEIYLLQKKVSVKNQQ